MSARQEDDSFSSNDSNYPPSLNDLNPDYKQRNGHGTRLAQPAASEAVFVVPSQHNGKSKEQYEKSGQDDSTPLVNGASHGNGCETTYLDHIVNLLICIRCQHIRRCYPTFAIAFQRSTFP